MLVRLSRRYFGGIILSLQAGLSCHACDGRSLPISQRPVYRQRKAVPLDAAAEKGYGGRAATG